MMDSAMRDFTDAEVGEWKRQVHWERIPNRRELPGNELEASEYPQ